MGCFGVESEKTNIDASLCISTACDECQESAMEAKTLSLAEAGLEPAQPYGQGILNP